ncbi:KamA family radical SAM protein [Thermodesulforhabdus norvegica]|uniref:L-lysine 2,3-aminomutase n=1 Tax=Thermodesulforhabdus norvegica TaxID=39841 RepID=A0A1I4UD50_9BACT|nr:KamA family radical SAM protein [Thermodesulforhabdus norvegica]SFM86882.1 L-lysine 2,3-aminomutase [Thermodesulforhabdus norvegica]
MIRRMSNKISITASVTKQTSEREDEPPDDPPDIGLSEGGDESPEKLFCENLVRIGSPEYSTQDYRKFFRKRFYPHVTHREWKDWKWQVRNRIRSLKSAARCFVLTQAEQRALTEYGLSLPFAVTPYYASLVHPSDPDHPLRRCVIPLPQEFLRSPGESEDPLSEDKQSTVSGIVHRYPDRVLFLATGFCATYCRYCTRSRMVGHSAIGHFGKSYLDGAIEYIEKNPGIRDVLVSGGDPLTLSDDILDWILSRLRRIRHVEIIRIGTKVPVVLPQRITASLARLLRKYHPLWMSIHFTHPDEITPEVAEACERLTDAGIPLGSQTVLLKGINDSVETMRSLVHGLLRIRVRPYYLYQCDPIIGSSHFRTTVTRGLEIISGLRGHTTGYAVPTYVVDAPGGGGKIPLLPDYVKARDGDDLVVVNYEGREFRYPGAFRE